MDPELRFYFREVEPGAGETDWTSSQAESMSGQHQILRSEEAILHRGKTRRFCADHHESACLMENIYFRVRIGIDARIETEGGIAGGEEMRFDPFRVGRKSGFPVENGKSPGLQIQRARCLSRGADQILDHAAADLGVRELPHGAPLIDCFEQFHGILRTGLRLIDWNHEDGTVRFTQNTVGRAPD